MPTIFSVILALTITLASSSSLAEEAGDETDSSWIQSTKILYGTDLDGGIFRIEPRTARVSRLDGHGVQRVHIQQLSADGRHLLFGGASGDESPWYLRDTLRGTDRHLSEVPARPSGVLFSPDSRVLAWLDERTPAQAHIWIENLADGQTASVRLPFAVAGDTDGFVAVGWSRVDAHVLYVAHVLFPRFVKFFAVDVQRLTLREATGNFDETTRTCHIPEHGKDSVFPVGPCTNCPRSRLDASAGMTAWIDDDARLMLTGNGTPAHMLEQGTRSPLSGINLRLIGWLEAGRYLLYQRDSAVVVYGVDEDRRASIADVGDLNFTW
jgi:hypothetical protein